MIRQWLRNFMVGRYGQDQLSITLMILALVLGVLSSFRHWYLLSVLSSALMIYTIYRTYSRNINQRWKENELFLSWWRRVKKFFLLQRQKFRDRSTYRYFTCPTCHQTLRVPKGKGKIQIKCPKCKAELIRKT